MKGIRSIRRRRGFPVWALLLIALGMAGLAAAAGHGYYHGASVDIKPRFDQPWQRIRYHDAFHDGHSHDGYGHGYHDSNTNHVHGPAGDAAARDAMLVVGPFGAASFAPPVPGYIPPFAAQTPDVYAIGPELGDAVGGLVADLVQGIVQELDALPGVETVDVHSDVSSHAETEP